MKKDDKVGTGGESKRVSTLEQYFSRSEDRVNMQTNLSHRENLRFCLSNKFPGNVDTAGLSKFKKDQK